jgi:hypothetical protein
MVGVCADSIQSQQSSHSISPGVIDARHVLEDGAFYVHFDGQDQGSGTATATPPAELVDVLARGIAIEDS